MSFAFEDDYEDTENGVSYERTNDVEDGKEVWLRHVKKITGLYDVSIVTHPAYEQTTVGMREASDAIDKAIEAQLKREAGNQETEEERKAREEAEAAAKAEEERKAREEAEAKAKAEQEERELEEQAQRAREQQIMRMRAKRRRREIDIESFIY